MPLDGSRTAECVFLSLQWLMKVSSLDEVTLVRVVEEEKPAEVIGKYAAEHEVDLGPMAAHGYSGSQRILRGSTADGILPATHVPVLLVRPKDRTPD